MSQSPVGAFVEEYCRTHPKCSTRGVSRAVYAHFPTHFKNEESARSIVRTYRAEDVKGTAGLSPSRITKRITIPKSHEEPFLPYVLNKGLARILILADIHMPYHSTMALEAALDYGEKYDPTHILLNGDTIDFYQLSKFCKDPRKRSLKDELEDVKQFLDVLAQRFPKSKIIYKEGNHEERLPHFLQNKAPELLGLDEIELRNLLDFTGRKIEWVGERRRIVAGKLQIVHGQELRQGISAPVNTARGLFLKALECSMQSHSHQGSEHSSRTLSGKIIGTWSTGCLCALNPYYARQNNWNHGFATVDLEMDGSFSVRNHKIINGEVF